MFVALWNFPVGVGKGVLKRWFFSMRQGGRKWMVLIRHWNLFVCDRWCIKIGRGRWRLGGRPGPSILCWSTTVVWGIEEDNRWQTKEKSVGRVRSGSGNKWTQQKARNNIETSAHDDKFSYIKEPKCLNGVHIGVCSLIYYWKNNCTIVKLPEGLKMSDKGELGDTLSFCSYKRSECGLNI